MQPFITGYGLITPLGRDASATWRALVDGRCIASHSRLESSSAAIARVISHANQVTAEAVDHAGWTDCREVAVIACTSKGSIEAWMSPAPLAPGSAGVFDTTTPAEPGADGNSDAVFGLADLSSAIARQIGAVNGPRMTLSAACASGLHGLIRGAMMIQSGEVKRALVVAAEASVHPLFLASFARLGVLPKEGQLCRPFDQRRSGFLMSEAAAAVCLEAEPSARGIVMIDRYAMAGDATHLTGSDRQGRVLRRILRQVLNDQPVDLIHAHGTGTESNDLTELNAIEATLAEIGARSVLDSPGRKAGAEMVDCALSQSIPGLPAWAIKEENPRPVLYSHKGALGHSLGASGLVSVVLNCLAHQQGIVPGNTNTSQAIPASRVEISQSKMTRQIKRSLVHAAGFGGPSAVVSLRSRSKNT